MPINFPGPYEVDYVYRVTISSVPLDHHLRVNCMALDNPTPGTPFDEIEVQTIGGTPANLETSAVALWNWLSLQVQNTVPVVAINLWRYDTGTFSKDFISAYAGSALAGANGAGAADSHQLTQSYRTVNGGIMKLTLLEDVNGTLKNRAALIANAAGSDDQKLAAYVISSAGWMLGRDDSFPFATLNQTFGENEATYKARHR